MRARDLQAHAIADELLEISDDGRNDWMERDGKDERGGWELNGEHIQRSRVRIDTRKWMLSKMLPKVYGDKTEVAVTGVNGGPVQSVEVAELRAELEAVKESKAPPGSEDDRKLARTCWGMLLSAATVVTNEANAALGINPASHEPGSGLTWVTALGFACGAGCGYRPRASLDMSRAPSYPPCACLALIRDNAAP